MPVNAAFAGCQGACGAAVTAPDPDVVAQPGANIGQRTFCPVSGAVFRVEATHHHAEIGGQKLWFCCEGCMHYFEQHRAEVLAARRVDPS
jgi:YHS domain-containing protein